MIYDTILSRLNLIQNMWCVKAIWKTKVNDKVVV